MSFYHAFSGIFAAIRTEFNLRFHIGFAALVSLFSYFYGLSRSEWAILLLCFGIVISLELMNTAVEQAVNTATLEKLPSAKLSKDAAAGSVLTAVIFTVLVSVCLFGDISRIWDTLVYIFTAAKILIPCLIFGILDVLFIIFGGKNEK